MVNIRLELEGCMIGAGGSVKNHEDENYVFHAGDSVLIEPNNKLKKHKRRGQIGILTGKVRKYERAYLYFLAQVKFSDGGYAYVEADLIKPVGWKR